MSERNPAGKFIHTIFTEDNVDTFRLWDWVFPDLFVPLRGRAWANRIPNLLTYTRLVLGLPVVIWLLVVEVTGGGALAAAGVLVALVLLRLTDIFDGRAARELGVVSDRGSKMDPLADGVLGFGLAAVAVVTVPEKTSAAVGFALAGYFVIRLVLDTAVMAQRVEESNRAVVPLPTKWGKLKYNLDYALLFLIHAGVLAHAEAGWPLTAALLLSATVAPLNLWFGMKNLQAHRARITPPVPVTMEPHRSR